jgi:hypothetical protein
VILDVETLIAAYGYDTKLERLPTRMICPRCHSSVVAIEWIVPDETPAPLLRQRRIQSGSGQRKLKSGSVDSEWLTAASPGWPPPKCSCDHSARQVDLV